MSQSESADLRPFGYAPGDYMITCHHCGERWIGTDKRATSCLPCAEKRMAEKASRETVAVRCPNCGTNPHIREYNRWDSVSIPVRFAYHCRCGVAGPIQPTQERALLTWNAIMAPPLTDGADT